MSKWSKAFLIVAFLTAILGFCGFGGRATEIAQWSFYISFGLFVLSVIGVAALKKGFKEGN